MGSIRRVDLSARLDGLRRVKRRADARYGERSRLVQFCAVGASGLGVDLASYATFRAVASTSGDAGRIASGALAVGIAFLWNFTWNRRLTFDDAAPGGSWRRAFLAYAASNALAIALSLTLRLALPTALPFFRRHELLAAVLGVGAATGVGFTLARRLAFRAPASSPPVRPASRPHLEVKAKIRMPIRSFMKGS